MTTTLDQTEAAFDNSLPQDGSLPDWNLLRVYADFLEERGREGDAKRAWVLRWMADKGAWPERFHIKEVDEFDEWAWWDRSPPSYANLSELLGHDNHRHTPTNLKWEHSTLPSAILSLVKILDRLGVVPKNL